MKNKKIKMKRSGLLILFSILIALSCGQNNKEETSQIESSKSTEESKDKKEIQYLIRQVLNWSNSKKSINILPVKTDSKDSVYIGFDIDKHNENLQKLRKTNFFSEEFIDNYNQIILTLDSKIKDSEYETWLVGDLPPFSFSNDVDPWCLCQDVPYDEPNPWDLIVVDITNLTSENGELYWKWGKPELNGAKGWSEFSYRFKVTKVTGKWRITYLEGFDFKESIKSDAQ